MTWCNLIKIELFEKIDQFLVFLQFIHSYIMLLNLIEVEVSLAIIQPLCKRLDETVIYKHIGTQIDINVEIRAIQKTCIWHVYEIIVQ